MITIGPGGDLRINATAGVIVVGDGALKPVGNNPPAYSKLFAIAATGGATVDVLYTVPAGNELFVKTLKVINYASLAAAAVFTLYRDGATAAFRGSIDFNVPIGCEFIIDELGERCVNAKGLQVA